MVLSTSRHGPPRHREVTAGDRTHFLQILMGMAKKILRLRTGVISTYADRPAALLHALLGPQRHRGATAGVRAAIHGLRILMGTAKPISQRQTSAISMCAFLLAALLHALLGPQQPPGATAGVRTFIPKSVILMGMAKPISLL